MIDQKNPGPTAAKANNVANENFPRDLHLISKGQLINRIRSIRQQNQTFAPEEILQMLNLSEIEKNMDDVFFSKAQFWESVRNIAVLLPLAFTWLALGMAASAFAQTIDLSGSNNNFSLQSFLYLWTQGFPAVKEVPVLFFKVPVVFANSWHILSFNDLVTIDAILILGVIVLTIGFHYLEWRGKLRVAALRLWIEQEIDTLCARSAVRSLGPGAENKRPVWAVEVHTAIQELKSVLNTVKSTMDDSTKTFTKTIDHFTDSYQLQNKTVSDLMESVQNVEKSIDQLNVIYQQGKKVYEGLDNVLPRIDTHFKMMVQFQQDTNEQLQKVAQGVTEASQAITQLMIPFQEADLSTIARTSARNMSQTTKQQEAILSRLADMEARLAQSSHVRGTEEESGDYVSFLGLKFKRSARKVE